LSAAPTPVITPQPIKQARSNGISFGTAIAERSEEHQLLEGTAVGESQPAFAVEWQRLRPLPQISLAQDRGVAVAIITMSAMRIPGQHDVVARFDAARGRADLFDDARGFMSEHDRQGITQRSLDHLEIGVAKAGRADSNQNVGRLQGCRRDRLDRDGLLRRMQNGRAIFESHQATALPESTARS
jgi:hypothetical protein